MSVATQLACEPRVRYVGEFGAPMILLDPIFVESALFGLCLQALARVEGDSDRPWDEGLFRLDRGSWEPI